MSRKISEILPILEKWQAQYSSIDAQYRTLNALTKCGPDAPISNAMWSLWDAYTACVSREIGDTGDWLSWYCMDNEMGARGLAVTRAGKKPMRVNTVKKLAQLIIN